MNVHANLIIFMKISLEPSKEIFVSRWKKENRTKSENEEKERKGDRGFWKGIFHTYRESSIFGAMVAQRMKKLD